MGAHSFEDLRRHVGHDIHCVEYGPEQEYQGDPANVAIECWTCGEVLMDFNHPEADGEDVNCKFCGRPAHMGSARPHDGGWVCDECWDERLRATE